MTGITNLSELIRKMEPKIIDGEFVFSTLSEEDFSKLKINALLIFREDEGITVVLEKESADNNSLSYSGVWGLITLTVHSELSAIGFLAAITNKLAQSGISVNVVSAYYHDHLFVPIEKTSQAMELLKELSKST